MSGLSRFETLVGQVSTTNMHSEKVGGNVGPRGRLLYGVTLKVLLPVERRLELEVAQSDARRETAVACRGGGDVGVPEPKTLDADGASITHVFPRCVPVHQSANYFASGWTLRATNHSFDKPTSFLLKTFLTYLTCKNSLLCNFGWFEFSTS